MTDLIDVVIPWLNPTDKWFNEYKNYCEDEDPCRIRDLQTMQPTLKGIIKNMPWVNHIWLIVYDEEQLENLDWPELKNEKIRIVYHRDIIPKDFLPNFNSCITSMFLHKIDGISENVIYFNDDMIINKFIAADNYFHNGKSVHQKSIRERKTAGKHINMWGYITESTHDLLKIITKGKDYSIQNYHMPNPLKIGMYKFLWKKYGTELLATCKNAKIRQKHSISLVDLAYWLEEIYDLCEYKNIYETVRKKFLVLTDETTKDEIINAKNNYDMVCLNDSEDLIKNANVVTQNISEVFV